MKIVLGTRGSQLATIQSGTVAGALRALGHDVELRVIKTEGDVTTGSLVTSGGTGVFAAALREALLAGTVDIAVHSFKDLPTAPVTGLVIGAVPTREDWHDVLCARDGLTLARLPRGARVGTGSPRRSAQLRALRPDLVLVEIRGNVGTRLARAQGPDADLDAVVLAAAGLARLGLSDAVTDVLHALLPAPAQGALAVECRADAADVLAALAALDDPDTRFAATAERAVLAELGAGCAAPVGALCERRGGRVGLAVKVLSADGTKVAGRTVEATPDDDPEALGRRAARSLLSSGAAEVTPLGATRASQLPDFHDDQALWSPSGSTDLIGRRVLLPRADGALADALRAAGADVDCVPLTETVIERFPRLPRDANWVIFTSPTAVQVLLDQGYDPAALGRSGVAAVGSATRRALEDAGVRVALSPTGSMTAESLAAIFPSGPGRVLLPCSALAKPTLAKALRAKDWTVVSIPTYTTQTLSDAPAGLHEAWRRGFYDAVALTSGSIAQAVSTLLGPPPERTRIVAFGSPTAAAASDLGLRVDAVAPTQDASGLVAAVIAALG
ncbi:hydroxymethylbilane synthase [Propioniciclava tarda]|nr:hydroxymethylbilane synthase [Propioniciclava tarda]